jgi:hypothetical protein
MIGPAMRHNVADALGSVRLREFNPSTKTCGPLAWDSTALRGAVRLPSTRDALETLGVSRSTWHTGA